jgi:Ser/Thr protein kinase RdoA (MazF antagonist)
MVPDNVASLPSRDMKPAGGGEIRADALADYLGRVLGAPTTIVAVRPLTGTAAAVEADPKGFGYGEPFEVECRSGGGTRVFVVSRTRPADGFGHDYPADRAWQALYGHPAYNGFPRHVRSVDVGILRASGELDSVADAREFLQIVEKADGTLYWLDLDRLLHAPIRRLDVERAEALGTFLGDVHRTRADRPALYERRIRELVGHGECLMGILDSYPHPFALLPPEACEALEHDAVAWRWRLRGRHRRLAWTHGDFHPWNLLFRAGTDFSVLDRSRGEWGEPADDVAALAINYLFFGLRAGEGRADSAPAGGAGAHLRLFRAFLDAYLRASGDGELLEVLPPFLAFRALVVAHPRWYPNLSGVVRGALLDFAKRSLASRGFDPDSAADLLRVVR